MMHQTKKVIQTLATYSAKRNIFILPRRKLNNYTYGFQFR